MDIGIIEAKMYASIRCRHIFASIGGIYVQPTEFKYCMQSNCLQVMDVELLRPVRDAKTYLRSNNVGVKKFYLG